MGCVYHGVWLSWPQYDFISLSMLGWGGTNSTTPCMRGRQTSVYSRYAFADVAPVTPSHVQGTNCAMPSHSCLCSARPSGTLSRAWKDWENEIGGTLPRWWARGLTYSASSGGRKRSGQPWPLVCFIIIGVNAVSYCTVFLGSAVSHVDVGPILYTYPGMALRG